MKRSPHYGQTKDLLLDNLYVNGRSSITTLVEKTGLNRRHIERTLQTLYENQLVGYIAQSGFGNNGGGQPMKLWALTPAGERKLFE